MIIALVSYISYKDARLVSALTLHYSSEEAHGRYRAADMEDRWQQQEALLAENISYMQQKAAEKKKNEYEKERQHVCYNNNDAKVSYNGSLNTARAVSETAGRGRGASSGVWRVFL